MKEVVVALDGSADSRRALRYAADVARSLGVKLRAVEAWMYPAVSVTARGKALAGPDEMDERTCDDVRSIVAEELGELPAFAQVQALRGSPAGAILQAVSPDSLLVLGARGRGGFAGLLLGSVSSECVEYASCPVVIVRGEAAVDSSGPVLVGVDGSATSRRALEWSIDLASTLGSKAVAVYAWQTTASEVPPRHFERLRKAAQSELDGWVAGVGDVETIEVNGDPRSALVKVADRMNASLLVVGRRGTSRVRGIGMGGVTRNLLRHSRASVAVLPAVGDRNGDDTSSADAG